jgi:hypothetical protein
MIWGMELRQNFGEFWPDGDFEGETPTGRPGWDDRLRLHYLAQPREEQKRLLDYGDVSIGYGAGYYGSHVNGKFREETGTQNPDLGLPYTPIEPHEPPQFFKTIKGYSALGSFIKFNDRIVAVDEALKAIIEQLEPGVHGFYPIEIRMPRGKIFPKSFYTLHICHYCDSFLPEMSNLPSGKTNDYTFSSAIIGTAHMWREKTFGEWTTFFSDELHAAIVESGLRTPRFQAIKVV